jgi:hypothetical protein
MLSVIQDLADRILDRVLGIDPDDELDDELSGLEQSPSPQLRRIGEILSTLDSTAIATDSPDVAASVNTAMVPPRATVPMAAVQDLHNLPNLMEPPSQESQSQPSPVALPPAADTAIADAPSFNLSDTPSSPKDLILEKITRAIAQPQTVLPQTELADQPPTLDKPDAPAAIATPMASPPQSPAIPSPSSETPSDLAATILHALQPPNHALTRAEEHPIFAALKEVTAIAQAWQHELQQLQDQQENAPVFNGWLEAEHAPDGTPQYRLCHVHDTGRILSQPCPLNQVAAMRQAIARYHQQCHIHKRQSTLQHQLETLTTVLTYLLHYTRHSRRDR